MCLPADCARPPPQQQHAPHLPQPPCRPTSNSLTAPVISYKYLGVIFDPRLRWTLQHTKAVTVAAFWASRIWRLSRSSSGVSTSGTKQLYNTVAVPRFTHGAEVWYTPLHRPAGAKNMRGSVDLLFNKLLFRAALRLCSLPKAHPLNPIT